VGKSNASECARNALFWRETEPVEGTDEGMSKSRERRRASGELL
jgi:hypothetical protein